VTGEPFSLVLRRDYAPLFWCSVETTHQRLALAVVTRGALEFILQSKAWERLKVHGDE